MTLPFWSSVVGVVYPYLGYPVCLWLLSVMARRKWPRHDGLPPTATMLVPVHNEARAIKAKVDNTAALQFPRERLQVLFISDGSTDNTVQLLRECCLPWMEVVELPVRGGKAAALNAGLARARNDVLIFTDASIMLDVASLRHIMTPFADPTIGCVSGEDLIAGSSGEAIYGRYELLLRRLESEVHSIVGASGSFYAQRRALCQPFTEGLAPDFLSVLRVVEQGARAVSEPLAVGYMSSLADHRREFERKVRTGIRGLTTLFAHAHLLNPFAHGAFAFALWSHKLLRWLAPAFMLVALVSAAVLADSPFYLAAFALQVAFYLVGVAAHLGVAGIGRSLPGKIALYFCTVNLAVLVSWGKYLTGVRQELWTPTQRS